MDNNEKLKAKTRLYSELEQELELSVNMAKHYLSIGAYDFLLSTAQRLVKTENDIMETSLEIKALREKIDDEVKDVL